jgi:hypothetical protein
MCGVNVEIAAIDKIYIVSAGVYFVPESLMTQPPNVKYEVVTQGNIFLLFSGELGHDCCDFLFLVIVKERS